jgi:hypothetical protein
MFGLQRGFAELHTEPGTPRPKKTDFLLPPAV